MNILKRELKANRTPFLFWSAGLFVLVFAGMIKYTGINNSGGVDINAVIRQFPTIVLAVLGVVGIDANTPGGYYSIISYFAMLCASIYAVSLGVNAVSGEAFDKTYEFLLTKPRKRSYILTAKFGAGLVYLSAFCLLNYIFAVMAVTALKLSDDISIQILLFSLTVLVIALFFYSAAAFFAAMFKEPEKGSKAGSLYFLFAFIMGIICDMYESAGLVRILSPFKYFQAADLLNHKLDILFVFLSIFFVTACNYATFQLFKKKDF